MKTRNKEMFNLVITGTSFSDVGRQYGISKERVRQIVHRLRRCLLDPLRLGDDKVPMHDFYKISELRANSGFWISQMNKLNGEK